MHCIEIVICSHCELTSQKQKVQAAEAAEAVDLNLHAVVCCTFILSPGTLRISESSTLSASESTSYVL